MKTLLSLSARLSRHRFARQTRSEVLGTAAGERRGQSSFPDEFLHLSFGESAVFVTDASP